MITLTAYPEKFKKTFPPQILTLTTCSTVTGNPSFWALGNERMFQKMSDSINEYCVSCFCCCGKKQPNKNNSREKGLTRFVVSGQGKSCGRSMKELAHFICSQEAGNNECLCCFISPAHSVLDFSQWNGALRSRSFHLTYSNLDNPSQPCLEANLVCIIPHGHTQNVLSLGDSRGHQVDNED